MNVAEPALDYRAFLERKIRLDAGSGFEVNPADINPALKPHVRAGVPWALRGGCRALFWSFGLQKTSAQLEIMRLLEPACLELKEQGRPHLRGIVLPLGVRQEFLREAEQRFTGEHAVRLRFVRTTAELDDAGVIYLTNYESVREGLIDLEHFGALSLDEAAVLRSFGSKTFGEFLFGKAMRVRYRFVATATPDPNEYLELIAYAHFLGVMDMGEAKTRFFKRNSEKADHLTLHPHKQTEFWLWVASWAMFLQRPSDLGPEYSDEGYVLPELDVRWHEIPTDHAAGAGAEKNGQQRMFKNTAIGVSDAAREKRESLPGRLAKLLELRDEDPGAHRIIWHDLEVEREAIQVVCSRAAAVYGSQDLEERERIVRAFSDGEEQELAAKPVMLGSGCNLQRHCWWSIYLGISHKFNDFIQSVHRLQRFGQAHQVRVDLIYTEAEREVRRSLEAKWARHNEQAARMAEIIRTFGLSHAAMSETLTRSMGVPRREERGNAWTLVNNDSVEELARLEPDSVGLVLTSIPFSTQYEYSPTYNDFGHTDSEPHFFEQMDYLTPQLLRALKPGRVLAVHCKNRVVPGAINGIGFQTISRFVHRVADHYERHGFWFIGDKTIVTDVVRENAQTYRLGYSEQCKDGSRMGCGLPEVLLLFRKAPTDDGQGYADERVVKSKAQYSRARWQYDAHGFVRSSGDRLLMPEDLKGLAWNVIYKLFRKHSLERGYDFEHDVRIAESLQAAGALPTDFFLVPPQSWHPDVWTDVARMRTLNTTQGVRNREKHLCPLQFDIVDRVITQYSNVGDLVVDPFHGLGTVPLRAVKLGRRAWGCELAPVYFDDSVWYLRRGEAEASIPSLFDLDEVEEAAT